MRICIASVAIAAAISTAAPTYRVDASWKPQWGGKIERITAAAVIENQVYAVERGGTAPYSSVVHVFDPSTGAEVRQFGHGIVDSAHGAKSSRTLRGVDRLFITDDGDFTIKLFDPIKGDVIQSYGTAHKEGTSLDPLQFGNVADVAVQPGNASMFFVVDGDGGPNNRLLALDWDSGRVLWHVGGAASSAPGQFDVPHSIAYDGGRHAVWVADRSNNRTQVFSAADGKFLFLWDCFQPGSQPWGIRIDVQRRAIIVADGTMGKVYVFDYPIPEDATPTCKPAQVLDVPPAASKLHEIALDMASGAIYIAQVGEPTGLIRLVPDA